MSNYKSLFLAYKLGTKPVTHMIGVSSARPVWCSQFDAAAWRGSMIRINNKSEIKSRNGSVELLALNRPVPSPIKLTPLSGLINIVFRLLDG